MDIKTFLKGIDIFRSLRKDQLELMESRASVRTFGAGQTVLPQGDKNDSLWIVMEGEVSVQRKREGATETLAVLKHGDVFGEMSVISGKATVAEVITNKSSRIVIIPGDVFMQIMKDNVALRGEVTFTYNERLMYNFSLNRKK